MSEKAAADAGNSPENALEDAAGAFQDLLGGDPAEQEADEKDETTTDGETESDEETLGDPDGETEGDEDEESENADEEEDEEQDADAEKPGAKQPALKDEDPVFTIPEADGTEKPITRAEAKAGYMRHKDYTQKRMAEAEEAKAAKQERETYGALNAQYRDYLDKIIAAAPSPAEMAKLKAEDPEAYLLKQDELRQAQTERDAADGEIKKLAEKQAEADKKALTEHLEAEHAALLTALPQWGKDRKVAQREAAAIRAYLVDRGFTPEQISRGMVDHRLVLAIRDAALYKQSRERAKTRVLPAASKVLKPGATKTKGQGTKARLAKADARLRQTGSVHDAAAAFEAMPGLLD